MKILKFSIIIILFHMLPNKVFTQDQISGSYFYKEGGLTLVFHPVSPSSTLNYPWYEAKYSNGYQGSAAYTQYNDQLKLAQFNYGQDQTFRIVQHDHKSLVLESVGSFPVYTYHLTKVREQNPETTIEVLAESNNHTYTREHFEKALRFSEFILGTSISEKEKKEAIQEAITEFKKDPAYTIREIESVDQQMQQLYQLSEIGQISLARSAFVAQLFPVLENLEEDILFGRLLKKYSMVLAIDQQNGLAFTEREVEGFFELNAFYAELYGQPYYLDESTKTQYKNYLIYVFENGDLPTKQQLCTFGLLNEYIRKSYGYMNQQQRTQLANGVTQNNQQSYAQNYGHDSDNLWPEGINTPQEKQAYLAQKQSDFQMNQNTFNMMQNMMTEQHVTSLNIIENMGSSGDYWEVKYNDY